MSTQPSVRFDEDVTCASCGCFGAYLFDGGALCATCYEQRGSCCVEFPSNQPLPCEPVRREAPPADRHE